MAKKLDLNDPDEMGEELVAESETERPEPDISPELEKKRGPGRPKKPETVLHEENINLRAHIAMRDDEIEMLKRENKRREEMCKAMERRRSQVEQEKNRQQDLMQTMMDEMRNLKSSQRRNTKVSVNKFTGVEDLEDYLMQFDAVAALQNWSSEEKGVILLSKLEGQLCLP